MWTFGADGTAVVDVGYHFGGVVDLMCVSFDYPESNVVSKEWVGNGPYRVWQNRLQGPQYGYWSNSYNDPVPGESWDYPEFKGYFAGVDWMRLHTTEGNITIGNAPHYYIRSMNRATAATICSMNFPVPASPSLALSLPSATKSTARTSMVRRLNRSGSAATERYSSP